MNKRNKVEIDTDILIELGIGVLGVAASIGGASFTGRALGNLKIGRLSGLAKICKPLGMAGLTMAGGYAAGEAVKRSARNGWNTAKKVNKMIRSDYYDEEETEEEETEEIS